MGLFSFIGDMLGGGGTTTNVSTNQSSTTQVDVNVNPQIGVDIAVDTSPIARTLSGLETAYSQSMAENTEVLRSTQQTQSAVANSLSLATLSSTRELDLQTQAIDIQNQLESEKLDLLSTALESGKKMLVVGGIGLLIYLFFMRK